MGITLAALSSAIIEWKFQLLTVELTAGLAIRSMALVSCRRGGRSVPGSLGSAPGSAQRPCIRLTGNNRLKKQKATARTVAFLFRYPHAPPGGHMVRPYIVSWF